MKDKLIILTFTVVAIVAIVTSYMTTVALMERQFDKWYLERVETADMNADGVTDIKDVSILLYKLNQIKESNQEDL